MKPQSNQRGIETGLGLTPPGGNRTRLNRTSVGLKRDRGAARSGGGPRLNRTSVGLKQDGVGVGVGVKAPQSNQRGIETLVGAPAVALPFAGLNRTSVGLKLDGVSQLWVENFGPQSNQRGIETWECVAVSPAPNRPQSNQRGIETEVEISNSKGRG